MATQGQGALALLVIIPVVWVVWLWVYSILFLKMKHKSDPPFPPDDRLKTRHRDPLLPNILQLSRNGLLRKRRQLSG